MSEGDLLCNFKKCRKVLTETAFITRCSHAFCEEDGIREIENQNLEKKCPACKTPLVHSYDLVKVVLNPSEEFKSMVLAGIRPEYVMDVATRAITFWTYQLHQEHLHQRMISKNLKEVLSQLRSDTETECGLLKSEIQSLKWKIEDLEKELEKRNQKSSELNEKLNEKTREAQKWQMTYESLRRKQLSELVLQPGNNPYFERNAPVRNLGPQTMDEVLTQRNKSQNQAQSYPVQEEDLMLGKNLTPRKMNGRRHGGTVFNFQPRATCEKVSPKMLFEDGSKGLIRRFDH